MFSPSATKKRAAPIWRQEEIEMEFFDVGNFCASCGKCCKSLPGAHLPNDFGIDLVEGVRSALATGRYAIDWWEGDVIDGGDLSSVMFIRPATKGKEGTVFDPSWGGECTFLTTSGCSLPREKMPSECKALRPMAHEHGECPSELDKKSVALAWRPYQSLLQMIGDEAEKQAA
jgi:hypothetical protein